MWLKLLILFLLFGFLGIFQTSFLAHFNIMGSAPNLIFILFFLAVFFEEPQQRIQGISSAIMAGFFLDILFSSYFGEAIISLLIIVFLLKRSLSLLRKTRDKYPIAYFVPLFILSFIVFSLFLTIAAYFLNSERMAFFLSWIFLIEIAYNLIFAIFGFYIFKKFKPYEFEK